ncbi:MAG: alpha/beta hydrolase [Betaproteobacteria bacterium]|nr:alpha/beta hydrolase [Betaproteobacteria bacterium]
MQVFANGLRLEVEDTGERERPAVMLIPGLSMQLIIWPDAMVHAIHQAGYRVIRMDNRDMGLSQSMDDLPSPPIVWFTLQVKMGLKPQLPYTLQDMAQDALAVLDQLQIKQAHLVGVSMGGMIAQRACLTAPERVLSLTNIMSSSSAKHLPGPSLDIQRLLLSAPKQGAAARQHALATVKALAGPGFEHPDGAQQRLVDESIQRSSRPFGMYRQMLAVMADQARAALLPKITQPTLVIHGKADPLLPFACGEDIARRIPNAKLMLIEGLGHDFPPAAVTLMVNRLLPFLHAHSPV